MSQKSTDVQDASQTFSSHYFLFLRVQVGFYTHIYILPIYNLSQLEGAINTKIQPSAYQKEQETNINCMLLMQCEEVSLEMPIFHGREQKAKAGHCSQLPAFKRKKGFAETQNE